MALLCCVCGDVYLPGVRWWEDWCQDCADLNFAQTLELRLHEELAPARAALEAYVTQPVTDRQRRACARLVARWAAEAQP